MRAYLDFLETILADGIRRENRTDTPTLSIWGYSMRYDLGDGFPLLTTKKVHVRSVLVELLGFIRGITDVEWYRERGCTIWDEWSTEEYARDRMGLRPGDPGYAEGDLGPIYPHQWRFFGAPYEGKFHPEVNPELGGRYAEEGVNQVARVAERLRTKPDSRQTLLCGWNPADFDHQSLPPCHVLAQFEVREGKVHAALYQRSADAFLGVPFNIAQYAFLTHMLAHVSGYGAGELVHFFGDAHIYENHLDQVETQLAREPRPLPELELTEDVDDIMAFEYDHFRIVGYDPAPAIRAPVAV